MAEVNIKETTRVRGNVYFPGKAFVDDKEAALLKQTQDAKPAQTEAVDEAKAETVESLVAGNSREELNKRAKDAGLDGDSYTNKTELATAILEAEK